MIGKITIGKSFRGCLLYCMYDKQQKKDMEPVMKDRAEVLHFNQCFGDAKELIKQFNEVRRLNSKLSRPVLHITLSLAPGERLPKDKCTELCEVCARDMGFEKNQYVAIEHRDTMHQHLHIVVNRIGYDGRTVSDSNNYKKIAAFCRKMEQSFSLQPVLSPKRFLSKTERQLPRSDKRKEELKKDIRSAVMKTKNIDEFIRQMQLKGYRVEKGRGIAFTDNKKVRTKGSEVGYSLSRIEQLLWEKQGLKKQDKPSVKINSNAVSATKEKEKPVSKTIKAELSKTNKYWQVFSPAKAPEMEPPLLVKKKRKRKKKGLGQ
ncbi:MAG: relaxase/mobilization nuclease domain-containing protein [Bacteroidetes bacterium]|nr:relaxase/mobilization nuclease domain-containing protein [Bacteroidota bacterium]